MSGHRRNWRTVASVEEFVRLAEVAFPRNLFVDILRIIAATYDITHRVDGLGGEGHASD